MAGKYHSALQWPAICHCSAWNFLDANTEKSYAQFTCPIDFGSLEADKSKVLVTGCLKLCPEFVSRSLFHLLKWLPMYMKPTETVMCTYLFICSCTYFSIFGRNVLMTVYQI